MSVVDPKDIESLDVELEGGEVSRTRRRRPSPKRVKRMRQEMEDGLSIQDAADKFKMPYFTVYQIRHGWTYKSAGGPIKEAAKRKKMSPKTAAKIRAMKEKYPNLSIDKLSASSGYGKRQVRRALAGEI